MGRRGGKRGRGGGGGRGGGRRAIRTDYSDIVKSNPIFEEYYHSLHVVDDAERDDFWAALRRELPNSFRFTGSKGQALPVQQLLKDRYIPEITAIEYDGDRVDPPNAIPWFPDQLAWQMTTPKNIIRKFPPFASFQKFLVSETSVGNISRQEVVSMIPPLLIDLKPGMVVLDMCAAPGSKAAQLIEMVHGGEEARLRKTTRDMRQEEGRDVSPDGEAVQEEMKSEEEHGDWSDSGRATGLLIANDADYKRAHMLTHQMKRLNSPNLIVTNHDATMFPSLKLPSDPVSEGVTPTNRYLKFDRILADVPCSGDGTSRKNINVWRDWTPGNGLGLFTTQVRILVRALQMLKVGGKVVYSTCSMNPVENEAVVATAISRCGGTSKVELIDCRATLPLLKSRPGLKKWKVMDKQGRIWQTWQEVEEEKAAKGEDGLGKLSEGMFTPSDDQERIPFDRCMRIYPHLQDTGGFFITVLQKKTEIKARPEAERKKTTPESSIVNIVNEIEARPANRRNPTEKIQSLDVFAPPQVLHNAETVPEAARPNEENVLSTTSTAEKRANDTEDATTSTKRPKIEEVDGEAPQGSADHQTPPLGAEPEASRPETTTDAPPPADSNPTKSSLSLNGKKDNTKTQFGYEEPFIYLSPHHPDLDKISTFYNLSPRFPRDRFMVRNATGHPAKTIYYTSALARSILTANANSGIKFIHCGVKMFVKQDIQSPEVLPWRIQSEGLPVLEAFVGEERVVRLWKMETLRKLLVEMFPKVDGEGWRSLGEVGERAREVEMGCCVLRVEKGVGGEEGFADRLVLPLWRSLHSLNLMLPKDDRKAMLLRLYNEDTPLMDHHQGKPKPRRDPDSEEEEKEVVDRDPVAESPVSEEDTNGVAVKSERGIGIKEEKEVKGEKGEEEDGGVKLKTDTGEEDGGVKLETGLGNGGGREDVEMKMETE